MNKLICTLLASAAVAVMPAVAQAKVVHTANRCSYTSDKVSPPPICGISVPEVPGPDESYNPEGGAEQMFGFKVSGPVALGIVLHTHKDQDGTVQVTKRPNAGQGQGRNVGSVIVPKNVCYNPKPLPRPSARESCGHETLNLKRGFYSLVVSVTTRSDVPLTLYSMVFTAAPSGRVLPYVYGLDCPGATPLSYVDPRARMASLIRLYGDGPLGDFLLAGCRRFGRRYPQIASILPAG